MAAEEHDTRHDAEMEAREDEEQERQIEGRLRKWKRSTAVLFALLLISIGSVIPFLKGFPLHEHWDALGKKLLLLSMGLLVACMYSAGTSYTFWTYLKDIRRVHDTFAPPGVSRRRTR